MCPLLYEMNPLLYEMRPLLYEMNPLLYEMNPLLYEMNPLLYEMTHYNMKSTYQYADTYLMAVMAFHRKVRNVHHMHIGALTRYG